MPGNSVRIVIDTNIWIAFLIGKCLSSLSEAINDDRITILFDEKLFSEFIEVVQRPKFRKYFPQKSIKELISLLDHKIEWIHVTDTFTDCRDPKDNFLLDLSVSGKADYLITGDEDLMILDPFRGVRILSYRAFGEVLEKL